MEGKGETKAASLPVPFLSPKHTQTHIFNYLPPTNANGFPTAGANLLGDLSNCLVHRLWSCPPRRIQVAQRARVPAAVAAPHSAVSILVDSIRCPLTLTPTSEPSFVFPDS